MDVDPQGESTILHGIVEPQTEPVAEGSASNSNDGEWYTGRTST